MKNLKNLVLSGAFVLAVVGAFAFQAVEHNVQTIYEETATGCKEKAEPDCTGTNTLCTNEFTDENCQFQARLP